MSSTEKEKRTAYEFLCLHSHYLKKEHVGTTTCPPYLTIQQAQEAFKEWLEQKHEKLKNKTDQPSVSRKYFIDELLEELSL